MNNGQVLSVEDVSTLWTRVLSSSSQDYREDVRLLHEEEQKTAREYFILSLHQESLSQRLGLLVGSSTHSTKHFLTLPFKLLALAKEAGIIVSKKILRAGLNAPVCFSQYELSRKLLRFITNEGEDFAEQWLDQAIQAELISERIAYLEAFRFFIILNPEKAGRYASELLKDPSNHSKIGPLLARVANRARRAQLYDLFEETKELLLQLKFVSLSSKQSKDISFLLDLGLIESEFVVDPDGMLWPYQIPLNLSERMCCFNKRHGAKELGKAVEVFSRLSSFDTFTMRSSLFYALQKILPDEATAFAELALEEKYCPVLLRKMQIFYHQQGNLNRNYAIAVIRNNLSKNSKETRSTMNAVKSQLQLYTEGFPLPKRTSRSAKVRSLDNKLEVAYLLHNSLPYNSGGYATRSHGILTALNHQGIDVLGITRYGFPNDRQRKVLQHNALPVAEQIGSVCYLRLPAAANRGLGSTPIVEYLNDYTNSLYRELAGRRVDIVHAASNFMNGVVGNYVARRLGVPSVYEVRGLWEVTRMSRQPCWENSEHYQMQVRMETEAAQGADLVITITGALKDEMVRRGIPEGKIVVIPNGVDSSRFQKLVPDIALAKALSLEGYPIIGYIGSIVDYEGLTLLLEASRLLRDSGVKFKVLIVGDGDAFDQLKKRADDLNLDDIVIFTGRVPHHDVEKYYSLVDICAFPRIGVPVTEMVSPIKPFEAMCMQKAIIVSDVAALKEIVIDGETGLVFRKDDFNDLATAIKKLLSSSALREQLGVQAREWAVKERDWRVLSSRLSQHYAKLLSE